MKTDYNKLEERVALLEEKIRILEEVSPVVLTAQEKSKPNLMRKILSVKEFLIQKNPKDDVQRTFYLGGYIEKYKDEKSFNIEDLKEAFRSARVPVPGNLNDKVNKNIAKGFFMDTEPKNGKKAWVLTVTGEQLVEMTQNKE